MGGGNQPDVDRLVAHIAHTAKYPVFQHLEQLGLDLKVDVANFVEEHGSVVGHLQQSLLGTDRAGKRAFGMAEEFGFEQLARKSGAIQVEKGFFGPRPIAMHPVGQHAFAGTGFALQQDGTLAVQHPLGEGFQLANRRAVSQEWVHGFTFRLGDGGQRLLAISPVRQGPQQHGVQSDKSTGLMRNCSAPVLDGANRQFQRTLAGQDDDGDIGVGALDPLQQAEEHRRWGRRSRGWPRRDGTSQTAFVRRDCWRLRPTMWPCAKESCRFLNG